MNRRQKALVTRRRMVRAACDSFAERGYAGTTMELIAQRAGVAVQTLYFTFNSKGAILREAVGAAIIGFDHWDPRAELSVVSDPRKAFSALHPWFSKFERAQTQRAALTVFVDSSVEIFERVSPLVIAMAAAAPAEPEVRATAELAEQRRVEGYSFVVELLAKRAKLRRGVTVRRATDVMLAILSAETYQHLAQRRGWSAALCKKWFVEVLAQQLLE